MKQSFTKQEIREVVQEIISDYWRDIFHKPLFSKPRNQDDSHKLIKKKSQKEISYVSNLDIWLDTFIDDTGKYVGPHIGDFHDGVFIRDPNEEPNTSDLRKLEEWNNALAEYEGFDKMDAWKANTEASNHFMNVIMNRASSFPT